MDDDKTDFSGEGKGFSSVPCSICLESVVCGGGERSIAKLQCGHEFHLDCIGSAFNAKGAMQCPNCRKVEKGRWLYANGYCSFPEFNVDDLVNEELYDLGYPEMPFGLPWCPFGGFAQLASLFEEAEHQPNAYHDLLGGAAYGDHPGASTGAHACPYLALHGYTRAMHSAPSNVVESVPDSGPYHQHPGGSGVPSSSDVLSSHGFPASDPPRHHHNWSQSLPFPTSLINSDQSRPLLPSRLSRNDTNAHLRFGSLVLPIPFPHGTMASAGGSIFASVQPQPPVVGDVRGHSRGNGNHMYSQSASTSSMSHRGAHFAQVRRARPGGVAFVSSATEAASSSEPGSGGGGGGYYGFSLNRAAHLDGESMGRPTMDRLYGWGGQEGMSASPFPWIPIEGDPHWWGPVHPNQNPQLGNGDSAGRSYYPQRVVGERVSQGGAHPRGVPFPRMLPFL
ncbi:hypothetical protein QJS10_CPA16g00718 [Acorus calamus]|uniref:RING-type domain-containing protein n=1 Tax=Acorus calamus TaxID=4465 RepID=A0AAV9D152_ACOCL|nr:hypothetical protein QJS10_CPA16g00718 [Acorus calamus]